MSGGTSPTPGPQFYIRGADDTQARGPFSVEQLASLAEAGQLTPDSHFYDQATEKWAPIGSQAELKASIWPEKKKLGFKEKEFKPVNQQDSNAPAITVQQFLDAAEGKTAETKGKKDLSLEMMKAAMWGTRGAAAILLLSAVVLMLPGSEAILALDLPRMLAKPLVFLGALDLVVGVLLLLGLISLYPFVRFRAVFGLGLLGFILWTQGNLMAVGALAASSAGLYFATIFVRYLPLAVALLAGLGGMAALAALELF